MMSRFTSGLWLFATLLALLSAAPAADRAGITRFDATSGATGNLGSNGRASPPSVQPRGPSPTIVTETRRHSVERVLLPDHDGPEGIDPAPASLAIVLAPEHWHPPVERHSTFTGRRAFDARAPPSLA